LAFGSRISLLELIAFLEPMIGSPLVIEHVDPRAGDVPHSQADCARLAELFPDVHPVPFTEGLAATVAWFRSIRVLAGPR
jgi:UDP-glucose 4-epimerase